MGGKTAQPERRDRTQRLVEKLLASRQEMLVLFTRCAALEPDAPRDAANRLVHEFCQILVDYIAAGHFGLYERVAEGRERRTAVRDLALELYPRIAKTTDAAVAFNDRLDAKKGFDNLAELPRALSTLGEDLASRIDLEDRVITEMLGGR